MDETFYQAFHSCNIVSLLVALTCCHQNRGKRVKDLKRPGTDPCQHFPVLNEVVIVGSFGSNHHR